MGHLICLREQIEMKVKKVGKGVLIEFSIDKDIERGVHMGNYKY